MSEREQGAARELHRLADVAHERGLRLFRAQDGQWLCTSVSDERQAYYVTALSCDCNAFIRHQRCSHLALLETLGWLPPIAGEPPALVPCTSCTCGQTEEWGRGHVIGSRPCEVCDGTRYVPPLAA